MKKYLIKVNGEQFEVEVVNSNGFPTQTTAKAAPPSHKSKESVSEQSHKTGRISIDSPMPGNVIKIVVEKGDVVKKGQTVFFLEAMKMENEIAAPVSGIIAEIKVNAGDPVSAGQTIIIIE